MIIFLISLIIVIAEVLYTYKPKLLKHWLICEDTFLGNLVFGLALAMLMMMPVQRCISHGEARTKDKTILESKTHWKKIARYKVCRDTYFLNWYISPEVEKISMNDMYKYKIPLHITVEYPDHTQSFVIDIPPQK